jgi:hypothetical protein
MRLPWIFLALVVVACSSESPPRAENKEVVLPPLAPEAETSRVPDRGRDPAVVALEVAGETSCSGILVRVDAVLTAARCASATLVYAGDGIAGGELLARVRAPPDSPAAERLSSAGLALITLDRRAVGIAPLVLREAPVREGDRVRAVSFGRRVAREAAVKLVRDAVAILRASADEFVLADDDVADEAGGPAIDTQSGEVVGVLGRAANVYRRIDVHRADVDEALLPVPEVPDAAPPPPLALTDEADAGPLAMGAPCTRGGDCATNLCASEDTDRYCTRSCGGGQRCPSGYHCTAVSGASVCKRVTPPAPDPR